MREMKDSGVEWIGEIPREWGLGKTAHFFSIQLGKMLQPKQERPTDTLEKYLCAANLGDNKLKYEPIKEMWFSETDKESFSVQKDDLLIVEGGDAASSDIVHEDITDIYIQNAVHRVRAKGVIDNRILRYLLMSARGIGHIELICNKATIAHFSKEKLASFPCVVSSKKEQMRVCNYLDTKCAQIDAIIARQQEIIEKLKAYKLSVITEAVTKGLNPDVPMKDSGVEWIGRIPNDWQVVRLKVCTDILSGYAFPSDEFTMAGGTPLLRGINVSPIGIRWDDTVYWNYPVSSQLSAYILQESDIVLGLDRPWISDGTRIAWVTKNDLPCLLLQRVCRIRVNRKMDKRWVFYWIDSPFFKEALLTETTGVSVPHISTKQVGQFVITIPPLNHQLQICDHIDRKNSAIFQAISIRQSLITKLTEYKKSLIYEVVTGKKEV